MQRHSMTDNLIYLISKADMHLITFSDIIIRDFYRQLSMIDLIFAMQEIKCQIMSCEVDWELESDSDHCSITTWVCLEADTQTVKQRRCWKSMNVNDIAADAQHFQVSNHLESSTEIDRYTDYLAEFIKCLVENTMLIIMSAIEHMCSWWTSEIKKYIQQAHVIHRCRKYDEKALKVNKHKKRIIRKVKISQF